MGTAGAQITADGTVFAGTNTAAALQQVIQQLQAAMENVVRMTMENVDGLIQQQHELVEMQDQGFQERQQILERELVGPKQQLEQKPLCQQQDKRFQQLLHFVKQREFDRLIGKEKEGKPVYYISDLTLRDIEKKMEEMFEKECGL